jgi:hypothetical protein
MAGSLDVLVRFIGDSSSIQNEVSKVEGTGGKIKGWAKGIGAAIGTAFAIKAVKDFVDAATALQDETAAAGEVFGKAATEVTDFGKAAADSFGLSQREAIAGANTFAAFGKQAGMSGSNLAGFSTDLVGLAGDLASFRGTSPEQAIGAIGSALMGQSEPMRAYGVLLDQGTLKARALSMGLVSAAGDTTKIASAQIAAQTAQNNYNKAVEKYGEGSAEATLAGQKLEVSQAKLAEATAGTVPELTAQQKVLATQAELYAQTETAQGDFARTSDSSANSQKKLKADIENMQAAIGGALLPVLEKLLPYLQKMAEFIGNNSSVIVPIIAIIGAFALAMKLASLANVIFGTTLSAALWPILLVMAAIAAVIAIVVLLITHWDTIKAAAAAVWQAIQVAWDAILAGLQTVWQFMQTAWDSILGIIQGVWDWISANWPTLLAILTGPIGVAVLLITKNWDTIKAALMAVWDWIKSAWGMLSEALTAPFRLAGDLIRGALDTIKRLVTGAFDAVRGVVQGALDFITSLPDKAADAAGRIANLLKGPLNAVIRAWNGLSISVPEFDTHIPGIGKIGGGRIDFPNIPTLAAGGIVTGPTLALIGERGPEAVIPLPSGGAGNHYNIEVSVATGTDPARVGRELVDYIRAFERANGRQWRATG